ncbi:hypothetical protein AAF712_006431 [Marasmius tenuissimus]|uniref:NADH:flavin oxidoreductase/NADH oxidase N-terminal domain-containing protein n=1 Tax=Marasmius tenuissimus TaxID=585030 RepID=A0ABR3A243_9AGAR
MTIVPANLFQPIKVGRLDLSHRVVLSPMTRLRTNPANGAILPIAKEYYAQRASRPGTLLVAEGTITLPQVMSFLPGLPGFWNEEQFASWKEVVDAVHAENSFIYLQLADLGRRATPDALKASDPSWDVLSPGDIPMKNGATPRSMTRDDIRQRIDFFKTAALNAIEKAGFDGIELHGANGFLIEQFLHDTSNNRTDEYGGSPENRARFALELVQAVSEAVGEDRVGLKLSPWNTDGDMGITDQKQTYGYLASELKSRHPDLAYLHVVEPRIDGTTIMSNNYTPIVQGGENDYLREIWAPKIYISAGGYTLESASKRTAKQPTELVGFGRVFLANPDLVTRFEKNLPLNKYKRDTFYAFTKGPEEGYTDYPSASA